MYNLLESGLAITGASLLKVALSTITQLAGTASLAPLLNVPLSIVRLPDFNV